MQYRFGGTGEDGTIDCIHLVWHALGNLQIPRPDINPDWYAQTIFQHRRAMEEWGNRVASPTYDGDVLWLHDQQPTFGVFWQQGCLCISQILKQVAWVHPDTLPKHLTYRYCRMKEI